MKNSPIEYQPMYLVRNNRKQMNTKEKIEKQILIAMNAMDEMNALVFELPEEEGYQDCFLSNLVDMKSRLKQFLNRDFDRLARLRKEKLF